MTERPKHLNREEQAKLGIGRTEFSNGVKWTLFVMGLLTLFSVPTVQTYRELWQRARAVVKPPGRSVSTSSLPCRAVSACGEHHGSYLSRTFRGNAVLLQAIDTHERDLKAKSFLTRVVLPRTQEILVRLGSGNEKAYVGRARWLFYRPGIDYGTGPGFLHPRHIARRAESGTQWRPAPQPDPRRGHPAVPPAAGRAKHRSGAHAHPRQGHAPPGKILVTL